MKYSLDEFTFVMLATRRPPVSTWVAVLIAHAMTEKSGELYANSLQSGGKLPRYRYDVSFSQTCVVQLQS
jgi:hypothetical protein